MVDYAGELIRNKTLHLVDHDRIRSQCQVVDCTIHIADARNVSLFCSTFVNTKIEVARTFTRGWFGCFFDKCIFRGKFYDCPFGLDSKECSLQAGLRKCDFTGSILNLCTFYNCAQEDLRLPGWPHVTIFYPRNNAEDFADLVSDPLLNVIHELIKDTDSAKVAITFNLPAFMEQERRGILRLWETEKIGAESRSQTPPPKPVLSLEHMRKLLQTKPYVFM